MTTRRGARDGDAPGERGEDRDAGDTNDELAGEDAKLRAMRSVWLSMRDEEPSSGGLAELMAAAHGKAAEMAPPAAWWQRVVAGLRRPPVLAFATVLVLLGGAMVVGRQIEREGATVAAGSASDALRAPPETVGGTAQTVTSEAVGQGQRALEQTGAAPPVAPEPAVDDAIARRAVHAAGATKEAAGDSKLPARETTSGDRPRPRPASVAPAAPSVTSPVSAALRSPAHAPMSDAPAPPVHAPMSDRPGAPAMARPRDEREVNGVGPSPAPAATLSAGADATVSPGVPADPARQREVPASVERPTSPKPQERSGPTPSVLYRRCEAAATRGDCAEVRRLVDQISTTDRGYRARVSKTSRIAKCLAE